ncbi:MAG: HEAT repeat domain-containing protein [Gemmatimonadota bacterium]|nr:HEAT repeat domain-containing protein [Gemmatimonadota bacterium]
MSAGRRYLAAALAGLGAVIPSGAGAQSLADRVAHAAGERVQFSYATRPGVCGDGRAYVHVGDDGVNEFYGSYGGFTAEPCVHGPARVVLDRADGEIVALRVYVGPPASDGATDLGAVAARDAAGYLLQLASSAQGAVARNALLPAMLADSVDNQSALATIARDRARAQDVRRAAIAWLGRDATDAGQAVRTLIAIANDDADGRSVRQSALSALARAPDGAGIQTLIRLAGDSTGGWLGRTALQVVAASGDPRSRDFLRGLVRAAALPDQALAVAIRSFGSQYASAADVAVIRDGWPKLAGDRAQGAAIAAAAQFGGAENVRWLMALAGDMGTTSSVRRRALDGAVEAGVPTSDLVAMYDRVTDPQLQDALVSALARADDRAATDKLIAIAKQDENAAARRRAVDALGRLSDPRARQALESLVDRRP